MTIIENFMQVEEVNRIDLRHLGDIYMEKCPLF
jgi:hypothetical protein